MKPNPWKKVGIALVVIASIAALVLYFPNLQGGRKKSEVEIINPAFAEHIASYSAGVISSGSSVIIVLASDGVEEGVVGSEPAETLFELSPSVKGKTVWVDRRTLEFKPDARMKSGEVYRVRFFLSKVKPVPDELKTFEYSFRVIPQQMELTVSNVLPYVTSDLKRQKIEGTLLTTDYADAGGVENALKATQDGKALSITWTHEEGTRHLFVVEEVARKEQASEVVLALNGKSIDVDRTGEERVEIPALGDFKVTHVRVEQGASQHVVIQFSDPLKSNQSLDGLITIAQAGDLDFDIESNVIRVYPPVKQTGSREVVISQGIQNILGYKLPEQSTYTVTFTQTNPAVKFIGNGTILPASDGVVVPFEAVSLKAVDVEIARIYESNIIQFLQVNDLAGSNELRRVARPVVSKKISLEESGVTDLGKWNRFSIDISQLIMAEPGAIYRVKLSFKKSYKSFVCDAEEEDQNTVSDDDWSQPDESSWWDYSEYYYDEYYDYDYDWEERDNPCSNSYYRSQRDASRNILASDLGLTAKRGGDGSMTVVVTDLVSAQPLSGVSINAYDYQQQPIASGSTNNAGLVQLNPSATPFVIVASLGSQRGYLRTIDGESLSMSSFDVGGEQVSRGIKGFLYGERGVWRPGDSLYLTFLLEDKLKLLPEAHPVVLELQNPQGQITKRLVRSTSENGFYKFATRTESDDPTGNWNARIKVGGAEFVQPLKIETVKPNRLKINMSFGVDRLTAEESSIEGDLQVNWLHGAPGKNLRAEFEATLVPIPTRFPRFEEYSFDDTDRYYESETVPVFDGYTDERGHAGVNATLELSDTPPGALTAIFRGKVYEESGNFSIDRFTIPYYPYESFVGLRLPKGDRARGMLLTDTTHRVDLATLDGNGNPVSRNNLDITIDEIRWRYWWETSDEPNFLSDNLSRRVVTGKASTGSDGKGFWDFRIKYPEWGLYYVKVCDPVSGHCAGKKVYIDWPGWAGRARKEGQSSTMLSFAAVRDSYSVGEKAEVVIPGSEGGRALISIENGSKVLQTEWLETQAGDNPYRFDVTREMTPNVFVNITLIQPHSQSANDQPMRLYGVIPVMVEDPDTHLNPEISMPDVLEPGQEVTIKVSEKTNRKMTYTVAVVDEGLLDLTRFKTPDAWSRFYAREALGVRTWDLFDDVIGAFGGKLERILAIGGDAELRSKEDDAKSNRFKPVVMFLGPYTLEGRSAEHTFTMPNYIGSVKTMLVAGYEGAYGLAEKATPVRKPLMVLATLPRVLGPEEKLKLPVTLFSMEKGIRDVKVEINVSGPLDLPSGKSMTVSMEGKTDVTESIDLAVKGEIGWARVEVTASGGGYTAKDVINIEVRNPNPPVTDVTEVLLEAGKTWTGNVPAVGMAGTNSASLEVSTLPPLNLGQRMKYLLSYPYGCIEQTTSSVFPQLYLAQVKPLTAEEAEVIQRNVKVGIERLKTFAQRDGGFAYWPGGENSDSWGTTYAGHFLLEAEAKGYFVSSDILKRWKKYQKDKAQNWRRNQELYSTELIQAYRLYTLALASSPEMGAMNRLMEEKGLPLTAAWMLAAAYVKAGQPDAARELIANLPTEVKPYREMGWSYGSDLRDKAIILETLILLGEKEKGFALLKDICSFLSNSRYWCSTQTIAWSLKSIGSYVVNDKKGELKFAYTLDGKDVNASTDLPLAQVPITINGARALALKVVSQSQGSLFVRVISEGTPARGKEQQASEGISLSITYNDNDGNTIDPSRLEPGTEFIASVTVTHPGYRGAYKNVALSQIFPSGWEINNLRLDDAEARVTSDPFTYQDIRDDRVYTFFDLGPGQRRTFRVLLTAAYEGVYYLPAVSCEAMYDNSIYARTAGQEVSVVRKENQ